MSFIACAFSQFQEKLIANRSSLPRYNGRRLIVMQQIGADP